MLTGENEREFIVIFCFDLGENFPIIVLEHFDKEEAGRGSCLANGFRFPFFVVANKENVVAEMILG